MFFFNKSILKKNPLSDSRQIVSEVVWRLNISSKHKRQPNLISDGDHCKCQNFNWKLYCTWFHNLALPSPVHGDIDAHLPQKMTWQSCGSGRLLSLPWIKMLLGAMYMPFNVTSDYIYCQVVSSICFVLGRDGGWCRVLKQCAMGNWNCWWKQSCTCWGW